MQLRLARAARQWVCASAIGLVGWGCSFTTDLDRLKADAGAGGAPVDAAAEQPPTCEKGVDCKGCAACESWCLCSALPSAYEGCVAACYDAGAF